MLSASDVTEQSSIPGVQHTVIRYRWLLPIGHLIVDVVMLAILIAHARAFYGNDRAQHAPQPAIRWVLLQEGTTVEWDPQYLPPPRDFVLLAAGNLPAALVSCSLRPSAHFRTRRHLWDPAWFLIHQAISFPIWFLLGLGIDSERVRIRRVMLAFLSARALFALMALVSTNASEIVGKCETFFWLAFGAWSIVWCIICGAARLRA